MTDSILTIGIDSRPSQEGARTYARSADEIIRKSRSAVGEVNRVEGSFVGLQKAAFGLRSALGGLGIGLSLSAFVIATKRAINTGDAINDMSKRTGIAVETLSKLKLAAEQSGTSLDGLATGLKFMNRNFAEAASGNAQAKQSFDQLGKGVFDALAKLNTEDKFLLITEYISNLGTEAERTKALMDIFGRGGDSLGILMEGGADGIKKAMDQAERLGLVLTPENAAAMDDFNDKWATFVNLCERFAQSGFVAAYDAFAKIKNTVVGSDTRIPLGELDGLDQVGARIDVLTKKRQQYANALRDESDPEKFAGLRENIQQINQQLKEAQEKGMGLYGPFVPKPVTPNGKGEGRLTGGVVDTEKNRDRARDIEQLQKYIEKEKQQNIALREQISYIGLTTIEVEKLKAARALDAEVAEKTLLMAPEIKAQFYEQTDAIKKQRLEIMQLNYDQSRTFEAGTRQAMADYIENIGDAASRARDFWENSFKSMEDALVGFVKTGKLSFRSLASSIIDDLIRIQIQQSITAPIAGLLQSFSGNIGSFFSGGFNNAGQAGLPWQTFGNVNPAGGIYTGFATGGIMTSQGSLPLNRYSSGGIADSPQVALFGEGRMNEAYVPLPDGRSIPVTMKGAGTSSINTSVVVNVHSDGRASSDTRSDSQLGRMVGEMVVGAVQSELLKQMRPGGLLKQQAA